jgi:type II secretory pathway pseudopilin PulG
MDNKKLTAHASPVLRDELAALVLISTYPRERVKKKVSGLTLVEVALIFCVVGIVLAVSIPTFIRTVRTSKIAEASLQLNALYQATAAYYENGGDASFRRGAQMRCLPVSAGPTPEKPSASPVKVDFMAESTAGYDTWRALNFNPAEPICYRYTFIAARSGCGLDNPAEGALVTLRAEGDLDEDGEYSVFERSASVDKQGALVPEPILSVRDRTE